MSVVLPVFNHAHLLGESIESILLERAVPLELIIVDDGSTDKPAPVVERYQRSDSRIRFLSKRNGGIASALNAGFAVARAPFLTWTSADNRYLPGAILSLLRDQLLHSQSALSYSNYRLIGPEGDPLTRSSFRPSDQLSSDTSVIHLPRAGDLLHAFDDNFIGPSFLYKRSYSVAAGGYALGFQGFEDYDYWLRLTAFSPARHIQASEPLYEYRLHPNSLTGRLDPKELAAATRARRIALLSARNSIELSSGESGSRAPEPSILRRARDSKFGAVSGPGPIFGALVGESPPPAELNQLQSPNGTTALFLLTPEHKESWTEAAARAGLQLLSDFPENFGELTEREYRERSLMFFMSSVDALVDLTQKLDRGFFERARYAALAGRGVRTLRPTFAADLEVELPLPAPHIEFYGSLEALFSDPVSPPVPPGALEEWLSYLWELNVAQGPRSPWLGPLGRTEILRELLKRSSPLAVEGVR